MSEADIHLVATLQNSSDSNLDCEFLDFLNFTFIFKGPKDWELNIEVKKDSNLL